MYKMNLSSDKFRGFCVISEGMWTVVLSVKCHSIQELSRCNDGSEQRGVLKIIPAGKGNRQRSKVNAVKTGGEVRELFERTADSTRAGAQKDKE